MVWRERAGNRRQHLVCDEPPFKKQTIPLSHFQYPQARSRTSERQCIRFLASLPPAASELRQIKTSLANPASQPFAMRRTPRQVQEAAGAKQARGSSLAARGRAPHLSIAHRRIQTAEAPPPHHRAPPKAAGRRRSPAGRPPRGRTRQSSARHRRSRPVRARDRSAGPGRVAGTGGPG